MADDETLEKHDRRIGENAANLAKALGRINQLEEENKELREELASIKAVVNTDPDALAYEELPKERKVFRVRSKLVEIAENTNGGASMFYDGIINMFDGLPSPGHAYDLMDAAAERDGFKIDKNDDGQKRITVKIDSVNDLSDFHAANKAAQANPA